MLASLNVAAAHVHKQQGIETSIKGLSSFTQDFCEGKLRSVAKNKAGVEKDRDD